MGYQNVFKRYEMKYLLTKKQQTIIQRRMSEHMVGDAYGRSTICNIYFDTSDYILARRCLCW